MGNEQDNHVSIRLLEQRMTSVENNMAKRSDIAVLSDQMAGVKKTHEAIEKLADKIDALITRDAKREESDKHIEKSITKLFDRLESAEKDVQTLKLYVAADKPLRDFRTHAIRVSIGIIVAAILGSAFYFTKN